MRALLLCSLLPSKKWVLQSIACVYQIPPTKVGVHRRVLGGNCVQRRNLDLAVGIRGAAGIICRAAGICGAASRGTQDRDSLSVWAGVAAVPGTVGSEAHSLVSEQLTPLLAELSSLGARPAWSAPSDWARGLPFQKPSTAVLRNIWHNWRPQGGLSRKPSETCTSTPRQMHRMRPRAPSRGTPWSRGPAI